MWDWLLSPIDPSRVHDVGKYLSWHARAMVLAWGVLVPLGIIAARYFKVLPGQDWPDQTDNKVWWVAHRGAQYCALGLMVFGLGMILLAPMPALSTTPLVWVHRLLGWSALSFAGHQLLSGLLRGSKGGPTDPQGVLRGDHYDMTPRRILFERLHKSLGYVGLGVAVVAIVTGLWQANAPRALCILIVGWWTVLAVSIAFLSPKLKRVPTYKAIWGPDQEHPGNQNR